MTEQCLHERCVAFMKLSLPWDTEKHSMRGTGGAIVIFPHLPLAEDTEDASGTPNNFYWQAILSAGSLPRADYLQKGLPSPLLLWVDQEDFTNKLSLRLKPTFSKSMVIFIFGSSVAFRCTTAYQVRMFNNNIGRTSATGASTCFFKELVKPICPDGMWDKELLSWKHEETQLHGQRLTIKSVWRRGF